MEVPIRVVARVKHSLQEDGTERCLQAAPTASQIIVGYDNFYDFDAVFDEDVSQKQVYGTCMADIATHFYKGFNATVISYGQQGTGKTYTMNGPGFLWAMNEEDFGLLPQTVRHIFRLMNEQPEREYKVHVSYLIINQEAVYDLLSPANQNLFPLNVLEDSLGNVVIPGLTVRDCNNITEVFNYLEAGLLRKHSASTQGFDLSSAHTMFNFTLEHQWSDPEGRLNYLYSRISFVDLAGSDQTFSLNYNNTGTPPESIKNNCLLNSDLKAVANIVQCLVNKSYRGLIPYRDSRLTHILKDSFGGNSITLVVCCVSSNNKDYNSSLSTLKLGSLTRYVVNFPMLNLVLQNTLPNLSSNLPSNMTNVWSSRPSSQAGNLSISTLSENASFRPISIPQQPTIPSQTYYAPCPVNDVSCYHLSQNGHENLAPNKKDEIFKIQFAASQWHLLVSSAESLLMEILQTGRVSPADKSRIQSWLCMKAEAEECIGDDVPLLEAESEPARPLEVIEELSEPSDMLEEESLTSQKSESELSSSASSLGEEFYLRLEALKDSFLTLTLDLIKERENGYLCSEEILENRNSNINQRDADDDQHLDQNSIDDQKTLDLVSVDPMSVSDNDSSYLSSESEVDVRDKHDKIDATNGDNVSCLDVYNGNMLLGFTDKDLGSESQGENIEMKSFKDNDDSDKENFVNNFGSRLSLISKSSSQTSNESKKHNTKLQKQKSGRKMVAKFKRMSSRNKIPSNSDLRGNAFRPLVASEDFPSPAVDIAAFSKEIEESTDREESGEFGASSEKELLRRVSSKFVSVSKGSSKCVNNIKTKSCQLKRSIRDHIFKKRNKSNQLSVDGVISETCRSSNSIGNPCSVRRVNDELKAAKERLQELKATIRVKEAFIEELKISGREAEATKRKCESQMGQLQVELNMVSEKQQEAQAKMRELSDDEDEKLKYQNKVYNFSHKIDSIRKRIGSLEKVASISQQNESKVMEVEKSLRVLREEQEELLTKFREELQWKEQLEKQILRKDRCARNPLCSSSQLIDEESDREGEIENMEALTENISIHTNELTDKKKIMTNKKRKLANSTGDSQSETSMRGDSRLGHRSKRNSLDMASRIFGSKESSPPSAESIRKEIKWLRIARDKLIRKRQGFDKAIREAEISGDGRKEEKKLLEYDEAVEGLDSVIERKNEILTGKATHMVPSSSLLKKNDLEDRLKNLPVSELQFLLFKYFNRIIDLRIEFRKHELEFAELEDRYDEQNRYIHNLKAAYQQASLEMERRLTTLQREYQYKISYLLRQFNEDGSAGQGVREVKMFVMERQLYYYKHLSRELKVYLNQGQGRTQNKYLKSEPGPSGIRNTQRFDTNPTSSFLPHQSDSSPQATPQVVPRRGRRFAMHSEVQPTCSASNATTKVTRQKNKLIIQQKGEINQGN